MKTLLKNGYVLSLKNDTSVVKKDVLVNGNIIEKISDNIEENEADKVVDCTNILLMPGFKNAHAHAPMVFARSNTDGCELNDWLTKCIFPLEEKITADDIYHLSKLAILEYVSGGITGSQEMYFLPNSVADAFREMKFRCTLCGAKGGNDTSVSDVREAYYEINCDDDLVKYKVCTHAEYTLCEQKARELPLLLKETGSIFYSHSSESKAEVEGCKERHNGLTPIEFYEKSGFFVNKTALAHCIHLTDHDIEILKKHDVMVATCPGSNSKLDSGVCDVRKLLDNGITVGLGTDGAGSNNSLDMFKEMTLLYAFANIKNNSAKALSPYEVLKIATVNGAKIMDLENVDYIEEGKIADITGLNLKAPNMLPITNIAANIVYSGNKDNVYLTMVNGEILYIDKKFPLYDVEEIYENAQRITDKLNNYLK